MFVDRLEEELGEVELIEAADEAPVEADVAPGVFLVAAEGAGHRLTGIDGAGGSERAVHAAGHGEHDAAGEDGIDEAGGIAHADDARGDERAVAVGEIDGHAGSVERFGAGEAHGDGGGGSHGFLEDLLGLHAEVFEVLEIEHQADAGFVIGEGDEPEPRLFAADDEDVSVFLAGGHVHAGEVGEEGDLAMAGVVIAQVGEVCGVVGEAAGIDEEGGAGGVLQAIGSAVAHGDAGGIHLVVEGEGFLKDLCAAGAGVIEEDLIEGGAFDLDGFGKLGEGAFGEIEPGVAGGVAHPELGAAFHHESGGGDLRPDAELVEDAAVVGQQGLTDVEAGKARFFQHEHAFAGAGQGGGRGGSGGSATDDDGVPVWRWIGGGHHGAESAAAGEARQRPSRRPGEKLHPAGFRPYSAAMPAVSLSELSPSYDVVIVGGALSGAATATLLMRRDPGIRVLIVEKVETLGRRVGEATVEVSGNFLGRVLGLTQYLNEKHLCKQGLRFWFANEKVEQLDQASEIGPRYLARIPSYQIDRAALDEEVLRRACEGGAAVLRPATVAEIRLAAGGMQEMEVKQGGERRQVAARWIVDASGVAALLARKEGWWRPNTAHPTASAWARWKGVKDWDGRELMEKFPEWASCHHGTRGTATNHVIGDGWWSWWIPLKGGDMSVGVVFDQRLVDFPSGGGSVGERLKSFLMRHPVARELLEKAEYVPEDVHWRKNLPYFSTTFAGDGFALVGDAAAFMDPFYSPGMDWIAFTATRAADTIARQRAGEQVDPVVSEHNADLALCHSRWFDALYRDKYHYIGEYDLLDLAFRLDLSLYYWGVVQAVFDPKADGWKTAPFTHPAAGAFASLMAFYNRRFARIGARRRRLGLTGRANDRRRHLIPGFTLNRKEIWRLIPLLGEWAKLELTEGWRTWGPEPEPTGKPASEAA